MDNHNELKPCTDLLMEFQAKKLNILSEKLIFVGTKGKDVYNITKPFEDDGELIIAGRVESRDSEESEINFFKEIDGTWVKVDKNIKLELQDPFVTKISGELVLGGVQTYPNPLIKDSLAYRTIFYRGANINSLKRFSAGPEFMKDIRLLELSKNEVLVFNRPQGVIGGRGKIAFTIIHSLDELNADVISNAELLKTQFIASEWGGSNELHLLNNGLIGVLGHVSCFDKIMDKHYYAMAFAFNPVTKEVSPIKLIATRKNFKSGECKRKDIMDVIFSGGLSRLKNGKAMLYAGVSDIEAHKILIEDPFLEYAV